MSRIYYPRPRERAVVSDSLPSADLLREVRDIERRKVLLEVREAVEGIHGTENDRLSYSRERNGSAVKADVLAALRRIGDGQ